MEETRNLLNQGTWIWLIKNMTQGVKTFTALPLGEHYLNSRRSIAVDHFACVTMNEHKDDRELEKDLLEELTFWIGGD